ncbi:hypothetical protein CGZ80_04225 [Rhodopirellula sp. MGV]|nr:hypothetical protein CGZ80_04225 [Rhodopirellula sp. MGV]PNY37136.1 hypothetical protein C2E31_09080 [Rhodopirellula baltica]
MRWTHAAQCVGFVSLFLIFCYVPVANPATWNQVVRGASVMSAAERVPLSEGIRNFQFDWLSSSIISGLYQLGGAELLSIGFACLQTVILFGWSRLFVRLSGRWWTSLAAIVLAGVCIPMLGGLTSQTFGQIALVACASLLVAPAESESRLVSWKQASRSRWIAMAILFAVWCNLDASFIVGLIWLSLFAIVSLVQTGIQQGWATAFGCGETKRRFLLVEIAALATLVNPQGWHLWEALLWWPDNPLFNAIGGWNPSAMASPLGIFVFATWGIWSALKREGQWMAFWAASMLIATIAIACDSAFSIWFAPITLLSISAVVGRTEGVAEVASNIDATEKPLRFAFTLVSALVLWMGFSFSPMAAYVLGGKTRTAEQCLGDDIPIAFRSYLQGKKINGVLYCPDKWSDWIQTTVATPVMVGSDLTNVPESVRQDYFTIAQGNAAWSRIAEKYAFGGIVIDKTNQSSWVRQVRRGVSPWAIAYEDTQVILLQKPQ